MNCYGYASHLYYPDGSSGSPYKQQPGEFGYNTEPFSSLMQSYVYAMTYWNNMYYFVHDRIYEDYGTLSAVCSEFSTLTETTRTASVPDGQRKIALTIRQDGYNSDYHFYLRHSDGTWSHKPGSTAITDISLTSGVQITDSNIATTITEGGYDDGARYYLIAKSVVVDFPHFFGHDASTQYTTDDFRDKAGDVLEKSFTITNSWNCRFDYPDEKDFFKFTPTSSGTYNIYTDRGAGYNIDGAVFDNNGNMLVYDTSPNNADFDIYLTAGTTYYIGITDFNQHTGYYILWCYK
ncbi:MAG: hypothetical protein NWE96_06545 [Candidatus Bathyarchaeota archaeon]|nr:hypothetical protein [Candidatus Bathyarchaeota archaeon]